MRTATQATLSTALLVGGIASYSSDVQAYEPGSCEWNCGYCEAQYPEGAQCNGSSSYPPYCDGPVEWQYMSCGSPGNPEAYWGYGDGLCFWTDGEACS